MNEKEQGLAIFLKQLPIFCNLSLDDCVTIVKHASVEKFESRCLVQSLGTYHHHLYIVITGQLDMVATSSQGHEMVVAVFGPKSMSSWLAIFHDTPAERSLVATKDTRLLAIPTQYIKHILARNPELYPQVLNFEGKRFRAALNWQQLVLTKNRTKRIAAILLMLIEISGDQSESPSIKLTHEQLMKTTQCSRQALHVSLKSLQDIGLMKQAYGRIDVLKKAELLEFSRHG